MYVCMYSSSFWNASVPNKSQFANFTLNVFVMATSYEESEKEVQNEHLRTNTYPMW